jgi:rhodanese-related sulfurtransferase
MGLINRIFGGKKEKEVLTVKPPPAALPPEPEPEPLLINEVSPVDLKARLDKGDELIVVDMRQAWEYQAGHIPAAKHMFIQEIPMRMSELPKDTDIVFQCWRGHVSLDACGFLVQNGWDAARVSSLSGGIAGWASTFGQEGLVKD